MKALLFFCLFLIPSVFCQSWTLEDILEMKSYKMSEEEIFQEVEKRGIVVEIEKEMFWKMKNRGFSAGFIQKFREYMEGKSKGISEQKKLSSDEQERLRKEVEAKLQADEQEGLRKEAQAKPKADKQEPLRKEAQEKKRCKIQIKVEPRGAGKVDILPSPDGEGKLEQGTRVKVKPIGIEPYLFDHWEGDAKGYQPLDFILDKDTYITASFLVPKPEPKPQKLDNPDDFKDTRRENYVYKGNVYALVEGTGVQGDWGLKGEVEYKYVYQIQYTSDIVSNNGYRIVEKRTFDSVQQNLLVSRFRFSLDINDEWVEWVRDFLKGISLIAENYNHPIAKTISKVSQWSSLAVPGIKNLAEKYFYVDEKQIKEAFAKLQKSFVGRFVKDMNYENFQKRFMDVSLSRVLGYPRHMNLLEGKSFLLEYEDGIGLVKIEVLDPESILALREKELIERAFYLSDYYIFRDRDQPLRVIRPGDTWVVDAKNLAGILDPRLRHKTEGAVQLKRLADEKVQGKDCAVFALQEALMKMRDTNQRENLIGDASFHQGKLLYDLSLRYVMQAHLEGKLNYRSVSQDHFFFQAKLLGDPTIKVRYECTCTPK